MACSEAYCSETAAVSAEGRTSVRDNDGVAEFGIAVMADIETVIQDKSPADSGMDRNIYDIFCRITECMLAYGREIGFIFNEDGDAEGTAEMASKVHLFIIAVRRKKNFAFMDDTVDADGESQSARSRTQAGFSRDLKSPLQGRAKSFSVVFIRKFTDDTAAAVQIG